MMKLLLMFVLFVTGFSYSLTGDLDTIEGKVEQSLKGFFENIKDCESSVPLLPRNNNDLLFSFVGRVNPGAQLRECVIQRIEKASEVLCQNQRDLDALLFVAEVYGISEKFEQIYQSSLRFELDFRNNLLEYADKMRDLADSTNRDYFREEYNALADSLYFEADQECSP